MPTSPWRLRQVRDKPVTSPLICPRRRRLTRFPDANGLVADLSRMLTVTVIFLKQSWHVAMGFETPKHARDFTVCRRLPVTSRWPPRKNFPVLRGSFGKVGVTEFGLYSARISVNKFVSCAGGNWWRSCWCMYTHEIFNPRLRARTTDTDWSHHMHCFLCTARKTARPGPGPGPSPGPVQRWRKSEWSTRSDVARRKSVLPAVVGRSTVGIC